MDDLGYTEAENVIQKKIKTNNRRKRNTSDRLKAERGKDSIKPLDNGHEETSLPIDLRRVKKLSDVSSLE